MEKEYGRRYSSFMKEQKAQLENAGNDIKDAGLDLATGGISGIETPDGGWTFDNIANHIASNPGDALTLLTAVNPFKKAFKLGKNAPTVGVAGFQAMQAKKLFPVLSLLINYWVVTQQKLLLEQESRMQVQEKMLR
jgi:hypothetical protein